MPVRCCRFSLGGGGFGSILHALVVTLLVSTVILNSPLLGANAASDESEVQELLVDEGGNVKGTDGDESGQPPLDISEQSELDLINLKDDYYKHFVYPTNDDEEMEEEEKKIPCISHFNGTLTADCPNQNVYKIATLNSSPQKCLHVESFNDEPTSKAITKCSDYPNFFDGTNGCQAYASPKNPQFCSKYGGIKYPSSPHRPNQACCACGGGTTTTLRFKVGDHVRVPQISDRYGCEKLRVKAVHAEATDYDYTIETVKGCGKMGRIYSDGKLTDRYKVDPGSQFNGRESSQMTRHVSFELRKCRDGIPEQEFVFVEHQGHLKDIHTSNSSVVMHVAHKMTNVALSYESKKESPLIIKKSFDGVEFEGSEDFFFILDGTKNLISGRFGTSEYSEAQFLFDSRGDSQETQFSMWTFLPVNSNATDDQEFSTDEHADWLLQMTQQIGIEYLEKNFAPWHILDVDRAAPKAAVKLRFRELSRHFHPDKNKSAEAAKIFVSLQGAYEGLKNSNEKEKEDFMTAADSESQLFSHSKHVQELLPFHWIQVGNGTNMKFAINVASSLNTTNGSDSTNEKEVPPSDDTNETKNTVVEDGQGDERTKRGAKVQLWVLQLYSARCGMSRAVDGFLDLAAQHLEKHENIKVAAYGCGLYDKDLTKKDLLGVTTDPTCKQFERKETPNLHLVVETLSGDDEGTNTLELETNSKFDYFYAAVPTGNSTQLHPRAIIDFAINGAKIWEYQHLVRDMVRSDFTDPAFMKNTSVVAFVDKHDKDAKEIQDALTTSLPALAGRFKGVDLYVGVAACGSGDEDDEHYIDCSALNVSWLPDVKIFGPDQSEGLSLVRDEFIDRRDVQIAIESLTNTLAAVHGLGDEDRADDQFEDQKDEEGGENESSADCGMPDFEFSESDIDLDQLEKPEDTAKIDAPDDSDLNEEEDGQQSNPDQLDAPEDKPKLADKTESPKLGAEDRPKLANDAGKPKLASREERKRAGGHIDARRQSGPRGSGAILGGGSGGSAGAISG